MPPKKKLIKSSGLISNIESLAEEDVDIDFVLETRINGNSNSETKKTLINNYISTEIPEPLNVETPYMLEFSYDTDYNIVEIHEVIRTVFSSNLFNVKKIKQEIKDLKIFKTKTTKVIDKNTIDFNIKKYEELIDGIESGKRWYSYISRAKPLLDDYLLLASDFSKGIKTIGYHKSVSKFSKEEINERLRIIEDYIMLTKEYIDIEHIWEGKCEAVCTNCNKKFENLKTDPTSNLYLCECGALYDKLDRETQYEKPGQMSNIAKAYDRKKNFEDAFLRYQGVSQDIIPSKIFDQLDAYFILNKFPIGDEIKKMETNSRGKKPNTSIKLLHQALKETGNADYYKIIYSITYCYWGWTPPDIGKYKDDIMNKYERNLIVYDKNKTRKSSLNVQLHLFQLLIDCGYKCELDDFKVLHSEDTLLYHTEQFILISKETGMIFTEMK